MEFVEYRAVNHVVIEPRIGEYIGCTRSKEASQGRKHTEIMSNRSHKTLDAALADAKDEAMKAGFVLERCDLVPMQIVEDSPELTSLQDILDIRDDAVFEQIASELPALLSALRQWAKKPVQAEFMWPLYWRPLGGASTITSRQADGVTVYHDVAI